MTITSSPRPDAPTNRPPSSGASLLPGLVVTVLGVAAANLVHRYVDAVGVLTWSVILGALAANLSLVPAAAVPGLRFAMKKLLRVGVVLLGFSLPLASILALGVPVIALVVVTLTGTLFATMWLGLRMRLGRPQSLLIATGFAICGASAIAAMEDTAKGDEDDVASAIAMVTIFGTIAMIVLPLLQAPLGLTSTQYGIWAGASVHEVAQVVAAASPAGAAAVGIAIVVKLTRVLLLAPVVAGVAMVNRRSAGETSAKLPPIVPAFVLAFLGCVALRSAGVVPAGALNVIEHAQTLTLSAALFGLGSGVRLAGLIRKGGRAMALGAVSTVVVAGVALGGVLLVG